MKSFVIVVLALVAAAQANAVYKKLKVEDRIVGGDEAVPNSYPYQAFIRMYDGAYNEYHCGGTLLTPTKILTAAHCMSSGFIALLIYLGAHNVAKNEETQQMIKAATFVVHEDYNGTTYANDIAIVTLSSPAIINEYVQLTRLPTRADVGKTYAGEQAIVSGWGRTSDAPIPSDVLRFVESPVITNEECKEDYENVLPTQICVDGRSHKVACKGDSGGPLVIGEDRVQVGIVSYSRAIGCEFGFHVAYTRVTAYLDWIAEKGDI